jgi:uncharacterized delta-60 repeat protein
MRLFYSPSRPSVTPARRPLSFRPRLEVLEGRDVPSAGPLDTTFGAGGSVTTLLGSGSFAYATALQADGKILAGGTATAANNTGQFALARYTPSGSLDTTFGSGGKVTTNIDRSSRAAALVVQPGDGKIVLGGTAGSHFGLARYTTGGSLDNTFSSKGIKTTTFPGSLGDDEIQALAIQPDGKILAAGTSKQNNPANGNYPQWEFALARYNSNSSLDASFGSGGTVLTNLGSSQTALNAVALQPDGKIVVAGSVSNVGAGNTFTVARYNSNGSLDTGFGGTGLVYVSLNLHGRANSVVIQPDAKIVAAGWVSTRDASGYWQPEQWALVRCNPDGSLDGTFGAGGEVTVSVVPGSGVSDSAYGVALQPNGKLVVAGTHNDSRSPASFALGRFNADGSLDTTFYGTGLLTTTIGTSADARGVLIQPADGKIVVAGGATVNGVSNFAVARYLAADPAIGSFTASSYTVTAGSSLTLTASNITDTNPNGTITQVALYLNGSLLGYGTQSSPGVWTFTFTVSLAPGSYTLTAQAQDNYGLLSDPFALTLTVQ